MLSLSPDRREQVFAAGVVCLIMSGVMLLVHFSFRPVKPVQPVRTVPALVSPSPSGSGENPAWAPVQKHRRGSKNPAPTTHTNAPVPPA